MYQVACYMARHISKCNILIIRLNDDIKYVENNKTCITSNTFYLTVKGFITIIKIAPTSLM